MTHDGEHTADNHHQSADADREAVHNARHSSQAYVLTERRDWRTTEQARHTTYEAVATDGCAHLLCLRVAVQRTVAQRRRIADSLRSRHKINSHNREYRTDVELRRKRHKTRHRHYSQARNTAEVNHSHKTSKDVAHDKAHKNRKRTKESLCENLAKKTSKQRNRTHNPVVQAAKIGRTHAACKRIGSNRQERETDSRNYRSRHDVRNELYPILHEQAEHALNKSAHDNRTDKRAHAVCTGDADGKREERERDAHDDRQTRTDAPHGEQLHKRTNAGYHHTVLYKCRTDRAVKSDNACQNHDWGDVADKHRQHMLQTERESLSQRHSTVKLIEILN